MILRKWIACTLILVLLFSGGFSGEAKAENHAAFHDVTSTFWAAEAIHEMAKIGVINGYEGNLFKPNDPVTREEFAALLAKTFNLDQPASSPTFSDVAASRWSYAAIESAKDYFPGYSVGSGAPYFDPKAEATREDVASALVRTLGYIDDQQHESILHAFRDAADITPQLRADVALAARKGLVSGYENGTFRPKATVTRAETAAILYRAVYGPIPDSTSDSALKRPSYSGITDFSQAVGWYGTVSQSADPNRVIEGVSSVSLSTDSEHTTTAARVQNLALDLSEAQNLMLRLHVEDISRLSKIEVRLSSTSNMAAYLGHAHTRWQLVQGWNEIIIPMDKFAPSGNETFENIMTTLQVSVTQRGDLPVTVVFDALYRDHGGRGKVMIQFDDGWESVYTKAYPMMKEKGLVGNIGIVSNLVGNPNYAKLDQLKEMYADGWDIFNHTANHPRLTSLTEELAEVELSSAKAFLMRNRFTRAADYMAYPYGDFNDSIVDIAGKYSRFARTITPDFEVDSPINPYRMKAIELVNDIDPAVYQEAIRSAADHGTTVIFFLHRIEEAGDDSIILHTDDFQAFLDYLDSSRDEVDVVSISEWYKTIEN
ncbi:hypothetical protein DUZ99_01870 [Xylanibacillus composti]|uniref:Polysaccharide deacetylase n=1 Tax=Xylanibacillus composti TaxID=1572762 RepID=A0A8J4M4L2_9BACL|nr:S-layer homology domain-containing protein [Xylanibacillus composti]MDT9723742.1 hypothetical protein [Xylanibacillus composti]GIQ70791.1 hypothetical protein XYCOK13_36150 [Xylanibacillus composti]